MTAGTWAFPHPKVIEPDNTGPGWWQRWRTAREERDGTAIDRMLARRDIVDLTYRWRATGNRSGLAQPTMTPLGGPSMGGVPRLVHVEPATADENAYLIVERAPGVTVDDLERVKPELAEGMGCWSVRFTPRGDWHLRIDLIRHDPLRRTIPFLPDAPEDHIVYGVGEHADVISTPLSDVTHGIMQGATRSGKSWAAYMFLAQLARRRDVDIAGIDPTGLLLRPWGPHPCGWRVCGTDAPERYEAALTGVVDEMDRRIKAMPPRCDVVPIDPTCPLIFVFLEEWAAVGRLLGHTRAKPSPAHKLLSRLLAEGAKAGVRVWTLVQRAEADVVGAFERDQALTNLSFGCGDINTLKMLHSTVEPEDAALHAQSAKGVALLTMPGVPLLRLRAPAIGSYGAYVDAVEDAVCPTLGQNAA